MKNNNPNGAVKRADLIQRIKREVRCADLLEKSRNALFCCPKCGSGHKEHRTGAVQVNQSDNTAHCHACGAHLDSIELIELTRHCDFNGALEYGAQLLGIDWPPRKQRSAKVLRQHPYPALEGESGRIIKVMYDKDAPVRAAWYEHKPDGSRVRGRKGYRPRLYVAGGELADATCVIVVEGEKDADSVAAFGCVAVSGENGAACWKEEYSLQLAGKHVILLGDNDKPGQAYLDRAQNGLLGRAKSVKRLDLSSIWPEIPQGGDISDYIAAVGREKAREQLHGLIAVTKPIVRAEKASELSREEAEFERLFPRLSEFEEEDIQWLVPGYLPRGGIVILAGDGGTGKTSVIANLTAAVSENRTSILGPVELDHPGRVLLLNAEDSVRKVLKRRLRLAGVNQERVRCPDFMGTGKGSLSEYQFTSARLPRMIRYFRPDLIVIDPFQSFLPQNVNMAARNQIRQCLQPLVALCEELGCTFVIVCHTNKLGMASGRTRIADSADVWDIARSVLMTGEADGDGLRYLSNEKNSYAPLGETVLFKIGAATIRHCGTTALRDRDYRAKSTMERSGGKRENAKEAMLTLLTGAENGELEAAELENRLKELGCSKATIRRAREALAREGKIARRTVGNGTWAPRKTYWHLSGPGERNRAAVPPPESFCEVAADEPVPFPTDGNDPFAAAPPPEDRDALPEVWMLPEDEGEPEHWVAPPVPWDGMENEDWNAPPPWETAPGDAV